MLKNLTKPELIIEQQKDDLVYLKSNLSFRVGDLVVINEKVTGVINSAEEDLFIVKVFEEVKAETVRPKYWWGLSHPKSILLIDTNFFIDFKEEEEESRLWVSCQIPKQHLAGSLGWTLTYKSENLTGKIACGNDFYNPGSIEIKVPGLWPKGNYYLEVNRFSLYGYAKLACASESWIVNSPVSFLTSKDSLNLI